MSFYITTPIYYVNDVPHVGHAYTTIAADTFARYHRSRGRDSYFLTGTDEHGQKIQEAAEKRGVTPIALADEVVERFKETWTNLDVANDDFIRTTEERHKKVVTEIWKRMEAAGDIYLGHYEGYYCVSCERFYTEKDLDEGKKCPTHKTEAQFQNQETYLFRMSKYGDALLEHIEANPNFIRPENYKNEVVSFVKSGLRDLSISRTTFEWGIPVPDAPGHIMYVWIDALSNYVSALGDLDSEKTASFWPGVHLIGKDILRFHAVYWPTMLMSAGLPLPESIVAHGWWTVRGEKISKSMPATRVDPNQLADDIGADALRYFLLREVPLGLDGDFSYESLIGRYNSELANDLGNLLNRTTSMPTKYFDGALVPLVADSDWKELDQLTQMVGKTIAATEAAFEEYASSRALEEIWALVREGNRFVNDSEPWKLAKDESQRERLGSTLRAMAEAVTIVARLMWPVMPSKAVELLTRLGLDDAAAAALAARWPSAAEFGTQLDGAGTVEKVALFPRIDNERAAALLDAWIPDDAKVEEAPADEAKPAKKGAPAKPDVSFDDFQRFDLRAARVLSAEPVPKTSKLLQVRLDVGELGERQVVAGIAEAYKPEEIVGKTVIFLANLAPATIRGVTSEGMILAAGGKTIAGLSTLDQDVAPGTVVR